MPKLKEYTVYTRTRGNLTYMCYNKRHALAHAVMECCVQAKWNPDEVLRWCIAEKGERKEGDYPARVTRMDTLAQKGDRPRYTAGVFAHGAFDIFKRNNTNNPNNNTTGVNP